MKNLADKLIKKLIQEKLKISFAESCTGGLLSATLTKIAGSSKWFDRGYITYSNNSKIDSLRVRRETLENFGAVSQEIANEMSAGALENSEANLSISITGIAGPEGGTLDKPIGTVFFSIATIDNIILEHKADFRGSRDEIRKESVLFALNKLLNLTL